MTGRVCLGVWHAECYVKHDKDIFPRFSYKDLENSFIPEGEEDPGGDEGRYNRARDGDHLMTPFQCDYCHFWNLKGRPPNQSHQDE
mmetsp:Transcript_3766/g.5141  ORF Transcript_3766/g.5141 Transcript_3766/m.5141 type:complete len:86 (+) Transcript_3766:6431-6688(+)